MRKILSALAVLFTLLVSLSFAPSVSASVIFSDSFNEGFSDSWHVATIDAPVPSTNGITGSKNFTWNQIDYSISGNGTYKIELDVIINDENTDQAWGLAIGDNSGHWKILNKWQSVLSLRENPNFIERNVPFNWKNTVGRHHFEILVSPLNDTPFVIIEDGQQLYSWPTISNFDIEKVWVSVNGYGDFELANFSLSTYEPTPTPTPSPTPSPTPTPTPTPTNTPTPTMTPSPTPSQPKKVILLHGMGGSWNRDALLNCKSTNYAGSWSPWKISDWDIYQPLINNLNEAGYAAIPFYYDWRQNVTNTASKLNSFIADKTTANEEVDIVGHSLGGLVGRAYLESTQANSHINNLITVGSPHQGSVFSYPAWSGGEMWIDNTQMRLGFTIMRVGCALRRGWNAREMVNNMMFSIQNTLPVFDYLKNTTGTIKPVSGMIAKNNWLPTSFSSPYHNTAVGTITGTGYNTLRILEVQNASRSDQRLGNWRDGKPTNNRTYADGDGTVLAESTQVPGAQNISLPLDHGALIYDPSGMSAIIDFLNGQTALQPLNLRKEETKIIKPSKEVSALMIIVDGAHATLTDKDGNETKDSEGQITILNPHQEAYTLTVNPQNKWWWKNQYKVIVVQLFEDGSSKWKEYDRHNFLKKRFKIRFDSKHKNDDIMRDK